MKVKAWDGEDDWLCMSCEQFTTLKQNYCAGCGGIRDD